LIHIVEYITLRGQQDNRKVFTLFIHLFFFCMYFLRKPDSVKQNSAYEDNHR